MPQLDTQLPPGSPGDRQYVEVTVEDISEDDDGSLVENPDEYGAVTTDYKVRMCYEGDQHIHMLGNTVPGPSAYGNSVSFVQIANQTLLWKADWTACRWRKKPKIPNYNQYGSSNWVLLRKHIEPGMVTQGPDGVSLIYRISGTYWYGHKNPDADIGRNANFAAAPWLDNTMQYVQDRTIDDTMYEDNIINVV